MINLFSNQIHEFENIVFDFKMKDIIFNDSVLVASLIKQLSPSWCYFQRVLKQKLKNFCFDELLICLRIENKHRETLNVLSNDFQAKAHFVETLHKPKPKNFKKTGFNINQNINFGNKKDKHINQKKLVA